MQEPYSKTLRDLASREQAADRLFMARDRADGRQAVSNRPIADSRMTFPESRSNPPNR